MTDRDAKVATVALAALTAEIVECRRCPRLVQWRERVAREKVARFRDEPYWGRPVPGFGDPNGGILLVGLAPAAHGGNRTGRVFTGDASGDFLWPALYAVGLADRPVSRRADDGLTLTDAYIAAAVRCAPPQNKPTVDERDACAPFLARELALLAELRVIIALGQFGWDAALRALRDLGHEIRPRPRFGHGAEAVVGPYILLGTYHPSQQNTFTGRLTAAMFGEVIARGCAILRDPTSSGAGLAGARRRSLVGDAVDPGGEGGQIRHEGALHEVGDVVMGPDADDS
jgi:uracil-DNA glycosylase family 4